VADVKPRFSTDTRGAFSWSLSIDTSVVQGAPTADEVEAPAAPEPDADEAADAGTPSSTNGGG
jgi:hypothetical protein